MATYTVQPEDTLGDIAEQYDTTVGWLQANNPIIEDPDHIQAGWVLTVPDTDGASDKAIPTTPGNEQIIAVIDDHLNSQGRVILEEAQRAGLELALACALVEQESEGQNIFGWDWGDELVDQVPFAHLPVTPQRVQALIRHIKNEGQSNGVGLTQLTYPPFIYEAETLGGAHIPRNQCRVGFELLESLLGKFVYREALAAYNGGEGPNRHSVQATNYATQLAGRHDSWKARLRSLEALPDTTGGVEPVPEYEEVTLKVGDQAWLYRENTDPIEWAKAPDLKNAKLTTDDKGWVRAESVREPREAEPGETSGILTAKKGTNFRKGLDYILPIIGRRDYWVWSGGDVPSGEGMYAINEELPPVEEIGNINCAGVTNLFFRAMRKRIPTRGNPLYDGGVAAYAGGFFGPGYFDGYSEPFDLETAKRWARDTRCGVLLLRPYWNATLSGQGHVAILLPSGYVLQSFPNIDGPDLNWDYTIEQSNASDSGNYYEAMVHPDQWSEYSDPEDDW